MLIEDSNQGDSSDVTCRMCRQFSSELIVKARRTELVAMCIITNLNRLRIYEARSRVADHRHLILDTSQFI